ncbi:PmbA protein [Litorimonas taeanensis]|uniref:PmbA protein n=1 Tax=Litorimonas taeanensis TaxID=568099 RepID=A0A420WE77_9PROT|nr:TldD/PmbA family protein [Litorimonas taeanensis]RKQ69288.1 PmbA protein [Litorimonas taeanensis]
MQKTNTPSDALLTEALAPTLETLLGFAKQAGAQSCDAVATHGRSLSVAVREGELEDVDNSEGRDVGLRVIIDGRQACVSSSDMSEASLKMLAERAVAMAKLAPKDPYCGLPDKALLSSLESRPDLELFDPTLRSPEALKEKALEVEAATLAVNGVSQAEGASANWASSAIYFATSDGFGAGWKSSRHGLSVTAIAERNGEMERDYDYDGTRWLSDLRTPDEIGRHAGERSVARLGSRQISSGTYPVIFEERLSGSLVSAFLGAINGNAIARGVSFLKDKMGEEAFGKHIQIIDDPHMVRGQGSRPWDGEGLAARKQQLVKDGILQTWLLNSAAGRQLGLASTGHATRGIGAPPGISATNSFLAPGTHTLDALIKDMNEGLLITEMFGPSLNSNTGDYSVGVAGVKIENGERAYPVSEVTIAGNLNDVFKTFIPANDIRFDGATNAPSLLAEGMTVAGSS